MGYIMITYLWKATQPSKENHDQQGTGKPIICRFM
jgi:hypothetical protein